MGPDGIPTGEITFWITVYDESRDEYRKVLLGDLNRLDVGEGRGTRYDILDADSLLDKMLDIIDVSGDLSHLPRIF